MPVTVFLVGVLLGTEKYSALYALNMVVVAVGVAAASYGEEAPGTWAGLGWVGLGWAVAVAGDCSGGQGRGELVDRAVRRRGGLRCGARGGHRAGPGMAGVMRGTGRTAHAVLACAFGVACLTALGMLDGPLTPDFRCCCAHPSPSPSMQAS